MLGKTFADLVRDTELKLLLPSLEKRLIARSLPMEAIGVEVRKLIGGVKVPPHIMLDVDGASRALGLGDRTKGQAVTVRACNVDERLSSASLERAVAVTRLHDMEARLKDCWASAFDADNLEAIRHYGLSVADAGPAILVAQTVPAEASGVLFSHAPIDPDQILIEAVWGFHEALGEGKFLPSRYLVPRNKLSEVKSEEAAQEWEYAQGPQGALVRREVPQDRRAKPKLSKLMVEELVRAAVELEKLIGSPLGVEWSVQGGVVFILQVVPVQAPAAAQGEASGAARHIEAVEAAELHRQAAEAADRAARAPAALLPEAPPPARSAEAKPRAPAPPKRSPPPPAPSAPKPAPRPAPALPRKAGLLPVIRSSLFVEIPPGSSAEDAAHIPHAGLVLDAAKRRGGGERLEEQLARAGVAVFPRPVLVEVSDLEPGAREALDESMANGKRLTQAVLERLLGPLLADLRAVAEARATSGATNLHIIAPFVNSPDDAEILHGAMSAAGLADPGAPRTLAFTELRNPSTLLYNLDTAAEQDGTIVRADRFYKALLREGEAGAQPEAPGVPSPSFVRALFQLTGAFERAGGTVLVLLETDGDFNTIWFYREIGVSGFITRLPDAEACVRHLLEAERRNPYALRKRGRGG